MTVATADNKNSGGQLLAFVDLFAGELDETGKGMLSAAGRLAGILGSDWSAICFAAPDPAAYKQLAPYGTAEIVAIATEDGQQDSIEVLGELLARAVRHRQATLLLLPDNDLGSALAPLVAASLDAAIATEVIAFEPCDRGVQLKRKVLGQRVVEGRLWDGAQPLVATLPVRTLSAVVLPTMRRRQPQISTWQASEAPVATTRIVERIPPDPQTVDLTEAEVIFSAGLGCKEQTFAQLQELCRRLNVSLGVTRPVYDLGWTDFERMVGQTGRTVAPRFYLALGISGSMHHLGGIKDSRKVVAVNTDPKAPIFPNADEGFVADLGEVLPLLLERAQKVVGGAQ
jgi:electron transfer flavoprotein alpha subunit